MRKAIFITLIIIFAISYNSVAQVTIKIIDNKNREPLKGATLSWQDGSKFEVTNADGKANLDVSLPVDITVRFVGYKTTGLTIVEDGEKTVAMIPAEKVLSEVIVEGFESERKLMETPGAVYALPPQQIRRFDETSLVRGLNTIPGVRMEQRSPGSYRISIRGSSLRSPFDVRNVKIYWNGIPFTDPNGITPMNLLDLNQMGRVEVIKGPAASVYGAGGGVIQLNTEKADFNQDELEAAATIGAYGLRRYSAIYQKGGENANINLNFSRQQADGWRDHTQFARTTAQFFASFYPSQKRTITTNVFVSDLFYEVPGGITREQFEADPRQARPSGFYPSSEEQNSSVDYQAFLTSLSQEYRFNDKLENTTSIYGMFSFFEMPFILDFERENRQSLGGRSTFNYKTAIADWPTRVTIGLEHQQQLLIGRNFGNVGGKADTIRFDDEVRSQQNMVFAQAEVDLPANTFLTLGLSFNDLNYDFYRLTDAINDTSFAFVKNFDNVWAPRIGVLKQITPNFALQGSISRGFSPPSVKEIRTGEGTINRGLEAELGINYELGFRGTLFNQVLNYDLTAFTFQLDETIVSFTEASGVVRFKNTGATNQQGFEANIFAYLIDNPDYLINSLRVQSAYTFHDFEYEDYVIIDEEEGTSENFTGKQLPGVSPHILVNTLDVNTLPGIYLNLTHHYSDEVPLNDQNTVFANAYHLFDFKLGLENQIFETGFDLFFGINNVFDIRYSLGNDINPFGNRYFQPAPGRNWFAGLKVRI